MKQVLGRCPRCGSAMQMWVTLGYANCTHCRQPASPPKNPSRFRPVDAPSAPRARIVIKPGPIGMYLRKLGLLKGLGFMIALVSLGLSILKNGSRTRTESSDRITSL